MSVDKPPASDNAVFTSDGLLNNALTRRHLSDMAACSVDWACGGSHVGLLECAIGLNVYRRCEARASG